MVSPRAPWSISGQCLYNGQIVSLPTTGPLDQWGGQTARQNLFAARQHQHYFYPSYIEWIGFPTFFPLIVLDRGQLPRYES